MGTRRSSCNKQGVSHGSPCPVVQGPANSRAARFGHGSRVFDSSVNQSSPFPSGNLQPGAARIARATPLRKAKRCRQSLPGLGSTRTRADMSGSFRACVTDAQRFAPADPDDARTGVDQRHSPRRNGARGRMMSHTFSGATFAYRNDSICLERLEHVDRQPVRNASHRRSDDVTGRSAKAVGCLSALRHAAAIAPVAIVKRSTAIRVCKATRACSHGRWFEYCSIASRNMCADAPRSRDVCNPAGRLPIDSARNAHDVIDDVQGDVRSPTIARRRPRGQERCARPATPLHVARPTPADAAAREEGDGPPAIRLGARCRVFRREDAQRG